VITLADIKFLDTGEVLLTMGEHPPRFVSPEDLLELLQGTPNRDSGWVDPGIKRFGKVNDVPFEVRYFPAHTRTLFLYTQTCPNVRLEKVPLPPMVMLGLGWAYRLVVLQGSFDADAKVCAVPAPNIDFSSVAICWGAHASPPNADTAAAFELFWGSPFNGHSAASKSKQYPDDVRKMWTQLTQQEKPVYPARDLIELPHTVGGLCTQFIKVRS